MFPLIAIGGAIGAIMSAIKGASWVSNQLDAANGAEASATSDKQSQTANAAPFEKALAAQAAGQSVPAAATTAPAAAAPAPLAAAPTPTLAPAGILAAAPTPTLAPSGILAAAQGTDYTWLARMQAGIAAYGSVGEHHSHHAGHPRPPAPGDGTMAPVVGNASLNGTPASASASTQSQHGPGSLANL